MAMLTMTQLVKSFGTRLLHYPDIVADRGDLILICGDSGTGKTTLCEMIAGFIPVDKGEINICGVSSKGSGNLRFPKRQNVFQYIHYISQFPEHSLIGPTCQDDLELWLDTYRDKINELLTHYKLSHLADIPVWKLSFGQKKALSFCALHLVKRAIWILDEPFAGLDDDRHRLLMRAIREFLVSGGIVLVTSHTTAHYEEIINRKVLYLC